MYQAFFDDEFKLYFLPETENGNVTKVSLFSKWVDKKGNIRNQEEYIPIFQKKNFLMDFDLGIYEKAFSYLQRWKKKGKTE